MGSHSSKTLTMDALCRLDLQVNGGFADGYPVDFSDRELSVPQIEAVTEMWAREGTGAFLPTVVTTTLDIYRRNLPLLATAVESPALRNHLPAIHLEGPFLSPEDGARGAHDRTCMRLPELALMQELIDLGRGHIGVVTLAPELPGALRMIELLVSQGVVVSLGHHLAGFDAINDAVSAGATLATHIGNACPRAVDRYETRLLWQIGCPSLNGMFITDGFHIPREFAVAAIRTKGIERVILTSDASPAAKAPPGEYTIFNTLAVRVHDDGTVRRLNGSLAGSGASLNECEEKMRSWGFAESECAKVVRENPWKTLAPVLARLGRDPSEFGAGATAQTYRGM